MDKYRLVTGYALKNGLWVSHSWVVDDKSLYETTVKFDRYFGIVLVPAMALDFWHLYVEDYYFPDGEKPVGLHEKYPAIAGLIALLVRLPREEWVRQLTTNTQGSCPTKPTVKEAT
jgi:hypothetical protein